MPAMRSGRVSTRTSLLPLSSRPCAARRAPRKSASVKGWRWIIVPMAPSRTRIRFARRSSSCFSTSRFIGHALATKPTNARKQTNLLVFVFSCFRVFRGVFRPCRDQYRERIAGLSRADADADVGQARGGQHPLELGVVEPEAAVAELHPDPVFLMRAQ